MTVTLLLRKELRVPTCAECISPDVFSGKSFNEIAQLQLWEGNRACSLRDVFEVEGESGGKPSEVAISLVGKLSKLRGIGMCMTDGVIKVQGDVGMHLGEEMKGGTIMVEGSAGSWAGSTMRGGAIEIRGSVGDYAGGTHRGGTEGMRGGTIVVHGNAGVGVGCYMNKGLIKVYGDVSQFAGIRMRGGTIVVQGKAGERAGAFMTGGKIVLLGHIPSILPTFAIDDVKSKVKIEEEDIKGSFYVFIGDLAERGSGKLYVAREENEHLKTYGTLL